MEQGSKIYVKIDDTLYPLTVKENYRNRVTFEEGGMMSHGKDGWKIDGYTNPHEIVAQGKSNIMDVDEQIIYNLDYYSIMNLCEVDKYFHYLCSIDSVWKNLIKRDFGKEPLDWIDEGKHKEAYINLHNYSYDRGGIFVYHDEPGAIFMSYITDKTFYLATVTDIEYATFSDKFVENMTSDMFKYLIDKMKLPTLLEQISDLEMLKAIKEKYRMMPLTAKSIIKANRLDSLIWLVENGYQPIEKDINDIILNDRIDMLEYLNPTMDYRKYEYARSIEMLDYLYSKGLDFERYSRVFNPVNEMIYIYKENAGPFLLWLHNHGEEILPRHVIKLQREVVDKYKKNSLPKLLELERMGIELTRGYGDFKTWE